MKKYEIVREYILESIKKNIYLPGMVIESENELSSRLNVSRVTVRKALDDLCADNTLFKIKGKGTFVAEKPKYFDFQCGVGFSSEIRKRNRVPSTNYAKIRHIKADALVAAELQIPLESEVWEVIRVRCADGIPIAHEHEFFPYLLMPDLTEEIAFSSIYDWLETKGIYLGYVDQKISAVLAEKSIASKMNVAVGSPLVKMVITTYTRTGTPFNFGETLYQTEHFQILQSLYLNKN